MQAILVRFGQLLVAGIAIPGRWVGYKVLVSGFLFFGCAITGVTDYASCPTVDIIAKFDTVDEDLFPCLQRRQLPCSALT